MPLLFMMKKVVSMLILPTPLCLILGIIGIILLWCCHKQYLGKILVTLSLLILLVFSLYFSSNTLLAHLENQYPPLKKIPTNIHAIVVLGGGNLYKTDDSNATELTSASLKRLLKGIELLKSLPHAHLLLSGGKAMSQDTDANSMRTIAIKLGVPAAKIQLATQPQDTRQQALLLKKRLRQQGFILVTSAVNMPRAMALFEQAGLHPIAAPAQFLSGYQISPFKHYIPSSSNLARADIALHEYFGLLWGKLCDYFTR